MALDYPHEKFTLAVHDLAESQATLQQRIYDVFISHLHPVQANDFPADLKPKFESLKRQVTRTPATGNEGTFHATIFGMSDKEAKDVIGQIVDLQEEIVRRH